MIVEWMFATYTDVLEVVAYHWQEQPLANGYMEVCRFAMESATQGLFTSAPWEQSVLSTQDSYSYLYSVSGLKPQGRGSLGAGPQRYGAEVEAAPT